MELPAIIQAHKRIILFDGVCNLCTGFLQFVYIRDPKGVFKFTWIQEDIGKDILCWLDKSTDIYETIIFIEKGKAFYKSDAFLKIVRLLKFPWPVLTAGYLLPRFVRDRIYDWVARNRYKWFGKKETCMIPTAELRARFLSKN